MRGQADQQEAVDKVVAFAREQCGLVPGGVVPSAVKGTKGNQEYLALFKKP